MKKQSKGMIIGASIGASVGALAGVIAGILMAPKSGKETRDDIASYFNEMKDKITEELNKVGDVTKDTYNGIVGKVVKAYETGKKITKEDAKEIQDKFDENYDKVIKTIRAKKATEVKKAAEK